MEQMVLSENIMNFLKFIYDHDKLIPSIKIILKNGWQEIDLINLLQHFINVQSNKFQTNVLLQMFQIINTNNIKESKILDFCFSYEIDQWITFLQKEIDQTLGESPRKKLKENSSALTSLLPDQVIYFLSFIFDHDQLKPSIINLLKNDWQEIELINLMQHFINLQCDGNQTQILLQMFEIINTNKIKGSKILDFCFSEDINQWITILDKKIIQKVNDKTLPSDWEDQENNLQKVQLAQSSIEYQNIFTNFQKTKPQGIILQIFRIQNKHLYLNYIKEKNDLIHRSEIQNIQLSEDQKEQYLWHGVRGQHPKIIYESIKEGFDGSYSNIGMWGTGIYFSTSAAYSEGYSYTLTANDGPQHQGKKVFLYCKVSTGRAFDCQPDSNLKRPPPLYDSVTGSLQIYILYQMDVRRAYPAYEVIYQ